MGGNLKPNFLDEDFYPFEAFDFSRRRFTEVLIMKKTLAVVLTVCVVLGAGVAFAQPQNFENREHRNQQQLHHPEFFGQGQQQENFQPCNPNFGQPENRFNGRCPAPEFSGRGHRHMGMNFTPDMPKEIREKAVELAKLRVDLEEAMSSNPLNKAKALDTYAKMQKVRQEIDAWRFAQKLERMEEFKKQVELNKKVPPAPMQPKPEDEPNK